MVGSATVLSTLPGGTKSIVIAPSSLQNGPDALGIVDTDSFVLLDALSYEGSVTMGLVTGVGTFDFVEGSPALAEDDVTGDGSLVRLPNGSDTDDAATDWIFSDLPTPGAANTLLS